MAVQGSGSNIGQLVSIPSPLIGSTLTLQFYLSQRTDGYKIWSSGLNSFSTAVSVSINSVAVQTISLNSYFTRYSVSTPAATSTMLVQFADVSPISSSTQIDLSFLIDNVTLSLAGCLPPTAAPSARPSKLPTRSPTLPTSK